MSDLSILIVDDEPLAIERLEILLARQQGVRLVGTASDGEAALRAVETGSPDLILLDIAMPGLNGIDVARTLAARGDDVMIVFVTAFDNFAVAAFDVAAVDYLMKPVCPERLALALERARTRPRGQAPTLSAQPHYLSEFWVPDQNGLVRIGVDRINRISAERDYMRLHAGAKSWLIHRTIARLEEELDPADFVRVHRSVILRRDRILGFTRDEGGHWNARMADGGEQRIGRSYADKVRRITGR